MSYNYNNKKSLYIEITLTNNCNCKCSYCFEGEHTQRCEKRNIDVEQKLLELLKKLCNNFDIKEYKWLNISFWGGEPFMNTEFMYDIINATYKYPFVRYHYYSNGILYNKFVELVLHDLFDYIKHKLLIQLSYDGLPAHKIKRKSDENIIFKTADLLLKNDVKFSFKATLTFDMIPNLTLIWESYYDLYLRYGKIVSYYPTLDTGTLSEEYYNEWKKQLINIALREYKFALENGSCLFGWFNTGRKASCLLDNSIHLHNDGNIYVCHGCPYKSNKEKLVINNIFNINSILDVITSGINDLYILPTECIKCNSTYCTYCHITSMDSVNEIFTNWNKNRVNNTRCKYFKYFGYISKLLEFALTKNAIWK